jgi:hypothetical protein
MRSSATITILLLFASSSLAQQNKKFLPGCPLPSALAGVARTTFDNTCGIKGASTVSSKIAESRAKNNFCVASPVIDITYDTLKELQQAVGPHDPELGNRENPSRPTHDYAVTNGSSHEGQLVRLAAFVHLAKYSGENRCQGRLGEVGGRVMPLEDYVALSVQGRRFALILIGAFAAIALLLSMVGIYGVTAYSVAQRTHEIGIRMALGAQGSEVMGLLLRQGMALIVAGVLLGIAASLGLTRFLASMLFDVRPTDPTTFALVVTLLIIVAALACWIPARRTMRVDPMVALRYE